MTTSSLPPYDSLLLVSFGGPEGPDDVLPFLENVLRGKNVPQARMLEVAEHYQQFGGVSPINEQNRRLIEAIRAEFARHDIELPIYWGNRNWRPLLPPTIAQLRDDGRRRALAFFTSMFSSYSGCRQYRENIEAARAEVGEGAPVIEKVRFGFNHPGFIDALADSLRDAIDSLQDREGPSQVLFSAHSIPLSMAEGCRYVDQLTEASRLVAERAGIGDWQLVYQSRSGPPQQPWLEPDVCDAIAQLDDQRNLKSLVIVPIGFISDHMEVIYDLDTEAANVCRERQIELARARTVGIDPQFVGMIRSLVQERLGGTGEREAIGRLGPWHDVCPSDCCLMGRRQLGPESK